MQPVTVLLVVRPGAAFFYFMVGVYELLSFSPEEDETHISSAHLHQRQHRETEASLLCLVF